MSNGTDEGTAMDQLRAAIVAAQLEITKRGIELFQAKADLASTKSQMIQVQSQMMQLQFEMVRLQSRMDAIHANSMAVMAIGADVGAGHPGIGPREVPGSTDAKLGDDGGDASAAMHGGPAVIARERSSMEWHAYERYEDAEPLLTDGLRCQQAIFIGSWVWHPAADSGPSASTSPSGEEGRS